MLKQSIDPTRSPWMSWEEDSHTRTVCKHCSQHYTPYLSDEENHQPWCKWWEAYLMYEQQLNDERGHDEQLSDQ